MWLRVEKGAHRADIWRHCVLWLHGGIYVDIKTAVLVDLPSWLAELHLTDVLVTVIGKGRGHIHQGFIAVPPRHPFIKEILVQAFSVNALVLAENMFFCMDFFKAFGTPWLRAEARHEPRSWL